MIRLERLGRDHLAIFLASAAVLLFEVALTRILSVVVWYHFAFLSISLAMLGLAAPGVWFALRPPPRAALAASLIAAGLALPASIAAIFHLGRPLKEAGRFFPGLGGLLNGGILLLVVAGLVPMLCLGAAICILLLRAKGREIGPLYAADLAGASLAAAAIVPLMHWVPTPLIVAGAGVLPLIAAVLVERSARWASVIACVVIVGLMVWGEPFHLRYSKEYAETRDVLYERWTPTARLTIFPKPFFAERPDQAFLWGMGTHFVPRPIDQMWIEQDGGAGTPITRWSTATPLDSLSHLLYDVTSVADQLGPVERACVIGAGGGRDVLTALMAGARDVDAVELNPGIVDVVSGRFGDFAGHVYQRPGVHAVAAEGRSFLTHSRGGYDLVKISLIDSWAATSAGAFALSENYLYTQEALKLYWDRLSPNGTISISRYAHAERLYEIVRLTLLARRALEAIGVPEPARHIAIAHAGIIGTVMIVRQPIDEAWFARFDAVCRERGFLRVWPVAPGEPVDALLPMMVSAAVIEPKQGLVDMSASTDDRPFFFQTVSVFGKIQHDAVARMSSNESSVLLLRGLLILMPALAAALLLTPFLFAPRRVRDPGFLQGSAYFIAIGLAFLFVEGPWIQRFILYLGHPSHATTVALASLLLSAGAGALAASRVRLGTVQRWSPLLPALLVALGFAASPLLRATIGDPFALRVVVAMGLLGPAGFLMGFGFPAGMERFGDAHKAWFWALNGVAGVTAIVFSLAFAISFGLATTAMIGAACYAAAALLLQGKSA